MEDFFNIPNLPNLTRHPVSSPNIPWPPLHPENPASNNLFLGVQLSETAGPGNYTSGKVTAFNNFIEFDHSLFHFLILYLEISGLLCSFVYAINLVFLPI